MSADDAAADRDGLRRAALALLEAHRPGDDREACSIAEVRQLLTATASPCWREQFDPGHLTASAIVVEPASQRALLILHRKLGRWLQPGGHVEPDDPDPGAAALREVLEETGLQARHPGGRPALVDVDVHPIPARKADPAHRHFDLRFRVEVSPEQVALAAAGDGASAVRWVGPEEDLEALGADHSLRRALAKVWGA